VTARGEQFVSRSTHQGGCSQAGKVVPGGGVKCGDGSALIAGVVLPRTDVNPTVLGFHGSHAHCRFSS